jgi:hypothetical protein
MQAKHRGRPCRGPRALESTVRLLTDAIRTQRDGGHQAIKSTIELCIESISQIREDLRRPRPSGVTLSGPEDEIRRWLDFRHMSWRYKSVNDAYHETYEWMFEPPSDYRKWDSFDAFLRAEAKQEPYFIIGKAGSGKSTLMKFLLRHRRTVEHLEHWAGSGKELLTLHYFFWNSGESLQKTHVGMLRALLHTVLDTHPELVPAVFPKIYRGWEPTIAKSQPKYIELKAAFALLIRKAPFLRLAIFVDGLDEFEGDHSDMSHFLRSITSKAVKVVVSSRPVNACLDAFSNSPSLQLQDLTRHDMKRFVDGELSSYKEMTALIAEFPAEAPQLAATILHNAEGVFLWVHIVVRLLVKGIQDGSNTEELYATLDSLPNDLARLYERMFDSLPPEYQVEAAHIFRLERLWRELFASPLPALTLSMALSPHPKALVASHNPINEDSATLTVTRVTKRVRSRCVGLLEVSTPDNVRDMERLDNARIRYHHQTVAEFLEQDDIWQWICEMTDKHSIDPNISLASACLSMVKSIKEQESKMCRIYLFKLMHVLRNTSHLAEGQVAAYYNALDDSSLFLHVFPNGNSHSSLQSLRTDAIGHPQDKTLKRLLLAANHAIRLDLPLQILHEDANARLAIVTSALGSWSHVCLEYRDMVLASLEHRKGVLSYHLKTTVAIESWPNQWSLAWRQAIKMCTAANTKDPGELLLVFLRCSNNPRELWRRSCCFLAGPTENPEEALKAVKSRQPWKGDHEAVIAEIERLISCPVPDPGLNPANGAGNKKRRSSQSKKRKKRH